ncbi:MAG: GxxExxY protein [Burkholderiales bacterium]|nr:GxxExxY protein [Burkholderiales bacterium]
MDEVKVSGHVIDAALRVHTVLGAGLLENVYEACLEHELSKRKLCVKRQIPMPVRYEDVVLDIGYRLDLLVEDKIVVEVEAVEKLLPLHRAQLLTYLKLGGYRVGLLLNFNSVHMREGINRVING